MKSRLIKNPRVLEFLTWLETQNPTQPPIPCRGQSKYGAKQNIIFFFDGFTFQVEIYKNVVEFCFYNGDNIGYYTIAELLSPEFPASEGFKSDVLMYLDLFVTHDTTIGYDKNGAIACTFIKYTNPLV